MAFTPITVTFDPPLINDPPATFDSKAFQVWLDLQDWTPQANAVGQYVSDETAAFQQAKEDALIEVGAEVGKAEAAASDSQASAENAYNYAQTVQTVANFKGRWSDLSGALSVPSSVLHNGSYWNLTQDIANVSAQEPSDANANWDKLEIIQEVSRPQAISPLSGATNVIPQPELSASSYEVIYSSDARLTRRFQVDLAAGDFSTPVYEATENADSHTVTTQLDFDTSHKWRCRDESSAGRFSQWMSVQSFTTGEVSIAEPTVSVTGSPSDVPESPDISTSAFSVLGGSDTHLNTDWQVLDDQFTVIWESLADATNKLSITVPSGVLSKSSEYTFRARHRGETYGESPWGSVSATTEDSFFNAGPGPQEMIVYDETTDTGYYGEVAVADLFAGDELASAIGLSAGTAQHSTIGWLKFYVGPNATCYRPEDAAEPGEAYVVFIAKRPYRNDVSWENIYQAGAVYGTDDNGLYPSGTAQNQLTTVTTGDDTFKVQLMTGAEADPTVDENGQGSYWNELMYRVHVDEPADQPGGNWDSLTDSDIVVGSGDGKASWMQETRESDTSRRVLRGRHSLSYFVTYTSSGSLARFGWRPCLVIVS